MEALDGTAIVRVLEKLGLGVPLDGLMVRPHPLGPDTCSVTVVGSPLVRVTVIVEVALPPRTIAKVDGLADIEKSNGALTVNVYVSVFVSPSPLPVIATAYVPVGVDELVDMVIVEAEDEPGFTITGFGLNDADAPLGRLEVDRLMSFEDVPPVMETVTVADVLPPAVTEPLLGETDIENVKKFAVMEAGPLIVIVIELLVLVTSPVHFSKAQPDDGAAV